MIRQLFTGTVLTITTLALTLPVPLIAATDTVAWYDSAWKYRQKITVNHELVSPVTGFPMLVKISGDIVDKAQEDGDDILFTSADGTSKRFHEIETFDGELVAWVGMPSLSEKEDTVIYIYYGNPDAENQQRPTDVWGNGYVGVWHLNDNAGVTQQDATSNDNDGTPVNIDTDEQGRAGKIGGAVDFDGVDDEVSFSSQDQTSITISVWIRFDTRGDSYYPRIVSMSGCALYSGRAPGNVTYQDNFAFSCGGGERRTPLDSVTDEQWYRLVATYDGDSTESGVYVDGVRQVYSSMSGSPGSSQASSAAISRVGNVFSGAGTRSFDGLIDELTISNTARSAGWIKTEYNNQSGTEDFLAISETEEYETVVDETTVITVVTTPTTSLTPTLTTSINRLFRLTYDRTPSFTEWTYWANRVIAGDKDGQPALLGSMQWQGLFGQGGE